MTNYHSQIHYSNQRQESDGDVGSHIEDQFRQKLVLQHHVVKIEETVYAHYHRLHQIRCNVHKLSRTVIVYILLKLYLAY
jgi:hypothetical protein